MSADGVFLLANVIGVIALGVGVMCAAAITISGKIRDDALKVELDASKITIEELRTANFKLEATIAPRRVMPEQQDAIAKALESKFAGKSVNFDLYILDVEAAGLGEQLSGALARAKIRSDPSGLRKRIPAGTIVEGILVSGKNEKLVEALLSAFNNVDIRSSRGEASQTTSGDKVEIIVGGSVPQPNPGVRMSPAMSALAAAGMLPGASTWDATIFVGVKPLSQP